MATTRPSLICIGCNKPPAEIEEYVEMAEDGMTPDDYCWEEEGTLNRDNGHFLCTICYVRVGMPTTSTGYKAP